jgi:SAM-dependent methyltransferase
MADYAYPGAELELFAGATRWKRYLRARIAPFLRGDVLEVGAGIGGTTDFLLSGTAKTWTCLEPDADLHARLAGAVPVYAAREKVPASALRGVVSDLPASSSFDCVLYVDVLEHIDDDRAELARAAARTRAGGTIVVMSPAHQWLYSPFDEHVGHCRRYDKQRLLEIAPGATPVERVCYLDAAGLLASLANRWLLRASLPTAGQINTWDKLLVPCSRVLDPLLAYRAGKSVLAVYRKQPVEVRNRVL